MSCVSSVLNITSPYSYPRSAIKCDIFAFKLYRTTTACKCFFLIIFPDSFSHCSTKGIDILSLATKESTSGGSHTKTRPLPALLPEVKRPYASSIFTGGLVPTSIVMITVITIATEWCITGRDWKTLLLCSNWERGNQYLEYSFFGVIESTP